MTKVLKTLVAFSDGDGTMFEVDTIEHQGKLWLVPKWSDMPLEGMSRPDRLICLTTLRHQKMGAGYSSNFLLNDPIPKALFDDPIPTEIAARYVVLEGPDVTLTFPKGIH